MLPVPAPKYLLFACLCVSLLSVAPSLLGQDEEVTKAEFGRTYASPDSRLRHDTWKRLNPENATQYKWITAILKSKPWYDRDGAIIALAKAATEKTVGKMIKDLEKNRDRFVRQGMAGALAKMNDPKFYPHLFDALDDKDPYVRRVVVHALRVHKQDAAVKALIDRFQKEKDPVVKTFIQKSLNELTQAFQGTNPVAWAAWWQEAGNDPEYKLGKSDEEAKSQAEALGRKLRERTTVSAAVTLKTFERGEYRPDLGGAQILILPPYGYSKKIMLPFLAELERINKLHYIDLPSVKSFKNLPTVGKSGMPEYPISKLVGAFEELRKKLEVERFAIMACGMNSWVAMRYASLNPKSVSHQVMVGPLSSQKAFGDASNRMESIGRKKNDLELWHLGLSRRFNPKTGESNHDQYHRENKLAKPEGEDAALERRAWSLFFASEQDSLISVLYPDRRENMSGVVIPKFRCFEEPKRNIPTLVVAGKYSTYSSPADCQRIAKHYGGVFREYKTASCLVFTEDGPRFNKEVAAFLGNKPLKGGKVPPRKKKKKARAD